MLDSCAILKKMNEESAAMMHSDADISVINWTLEDLDKDKYEALQTLVAKITSI